MFDSPMYMGAPCEHMFAVNRDIQIMPGCKKFTDVYGHVLAERWRPDAPPAQEAARYHQTIEVFRASRLLVAPDAATAARLYVINEYV